MDKIIGASEDQKHTKGGSLTFHLADGARSMDQW